MRWASSSQSIDGEVGALVFAILIALGVLWHVEPWLFQNTLPVLPLFLGSTAIWFVALRRDDAIVAKAVASVVAPVALALGILTILLLVLNNLRLATYYGKVATVEQFLIDLRFAIADAAHMPVWLFCTIVFLMIALANLFPHVRAVSVFLGTKKWVARFVAVLSVLTSFTLFAQLPAGDALERRYADVMQKFQAALRREKAAVARKAAAQELRDEIRKVEPLQKSRLASYLVRLQVAEERGGGAVEIATTKLSGGAPDLPETSPVRQRYEVPTRDEFAALERVSQAELIRAEEAEKGAEEVVGEVVSAFLPELPEFYGHQVVSKIIDGLAERVYKPWVEKIIGNKLPAEKDVHAAVAKSRASVGPKEFVKVSIFEGAAEQAEKAADVAQQRVTELLQRLDLNNPLISDRYLGDRRLCELRDYIREHPGISDKDVTLAERYAKEVRADFWHRSELSPFPAAGRPPWETTPVETEVAGIPIGKILTGEDLAKEKLPVEVPP